MAKVHVCVKIYILTLLTCVDVPEVVNLTANQTDPCTITVQWEEPFLLPGLSVSYTVSVYLGNITVSVHNVSTTTFTYHPTTGSGVYTVQVRTFNGTLTGDATNATVYAGICVYYHSLDYFKMSPVIFVTIFPHGCNNQFTQL